MEVCWLSYWLPFFLPKPLKAVALTSLFGKSEIVGNILTIHVSSLYSWLVILRLAMDAQMVTRLSEFCILTHKTHSVRQKLSILINGNLKGPQFHFRIKMLSWQYRKCHCEDRLYIHNGISSLVTHFFMLKHPPGLLIKEMNFEIKRILAWHQAITWNNDGLSSAKPSDKHQHGL